MGKGDLFCKRIKGKPRCPKAECKGEHVHWLLEILALKNVKPVEPKSGLDMEAIDDGETFIVKVALGGTNEDDYEAEKVEEI